MSLKADFADEFAGSAFGEVAGDKALVGKWGSIVELDDGSYDCWFVRPDGSPLTEHKLAAIAKKCPEWAGLVRLDGEAYAQGRGKAFVREMAPLAGIKRKRRISPEARAKAAEHLKSARAAQNRSE